MCKQKSSFGSGQLDSERILKEFKRLMNKVQTKKNKLRLEQMAVQYAAMYDYLPGFEFTLDGRTVQLKKREDKTYEVTFSKRIKKWRRR